jgi:hypothetical protein
VAVERGTAGVVTPEAWLGRFLSEGQVGRCEKKGPSMRIEVWFDNPRIEKGGIDHRGLRLRTPVHRHASARHAGLGHRTGSNSVGMGSSVTLRWLIERRLFGSDRPYTSVGNSADCRRVHGQRWPSIVPTSPYPQKP